VESGNSEAAKYSFGCTQRRATRCSSDLGAMVTYEDAIHFSRQSECRNRTPGDAEERCGSSPQGTPKGSAPFILLRLKVIRSGCSNTQIATRMSQLTSVPGPELPFGVLPTKSGVRSIITTKSQTPC
jgi:hypothetical protein